jgi:hypothetical protein
MRRRKRSFFHALTRALGTLFARPRLAVREMGELG